MIEEISWHEDAWNNYKNARKKHHFPHALLLSGAEGVGKKIFSQRIARSLLCTSPVDYKACNECSSCKTYHSGANPDYLKICLLEGKQQIGVDQIRRISEFLHYTRSFNNKRVVLLEPVERMNQNAANSLLKSLEEPNDDSVIILVTSNLSSVIPTIKSRCQQITLHLPSKKEALFWMNRNGKKEKAPNSNEDLLLLANGSPLVANDLPDSLIQEKLNLKNDLLDVIESKKNITEIAKKWENYDKEVLLNWQISWSQEIIKRKTIYKDLEYSQSNTNLDSLFLKLNTSTASKMWVLYEGLLSHKKLIHTSVNTLMFLENMLVLWKKASK